MFGLTAHVCLLSVEFDMDDVGVAADWTVFYVALARASRPVDRDDDVFAT